MILHLDYEELVALRSGVEQVLEAAGRVGDAAARPAGEVPAADTGGLAAPRTGGLAAPPELVAQLEALAPRLAGDLGVATLAEAQTLERALALVAAHLLARMDARVLEQHPGAEDAVAAYFDYAHVRRVHERVRQMAAQMAALIELMTGRPPTPETARTFTFPD